MNINKENVKDFWNQASCGEELYLRGFTADDYMEQSRIRYDIEPQIIDFGEFHRFSGKKTLEIGVGLGADHQLLAEAGADLTGIDLTPRAISHTDRRFDLLNLKTNLSVADAENLPFEDASFEAVYSYGVLHHSPNTVKAISEVHRILKPGGLAKIMIYHKYSIVGFMLWIRYGLFTLHPFRGLNDIYDKYLESPGTKAYSYKEARDLFSSFTIESISSPLGHGDLLESSAGVRHRGKLQTIARKIWPRKLIKLLLPQNGLGMLITVRKEN